MDKSVPFDKAVVGAFSIRRKQFVKWMTAIIAISCAVVAIFVMLIFTGNYDLLSQVMPPLAVLEVITLAFFGIAIHRYRCPKCGALLLFRIYNPLFNNPKACPKCDVPLRAPNN